MPAPQGYYLVTGRGIPQINIIGYNTETDWERLVGSRDQGETGGAPSAMNIVTEFGFGTVSSSLMALPTPEADDARPVWRFAAGRPDEAPFELVEL